MYLQVYKDGKIAFLKDPHITGKGFNIRFIEEQAEIFVRQFPTSTSKSTMDRARKALRSLNFDFYNLRSCEVNANCILDNESIYGSSFLFELDSMPDVLEFYPRDNIKWDWTAIIAVYPAGECIIEFDGDITITVDHLGHFEKISCPIRVAGVLSSIVKNHGDRYHMKVIE